LGKRWYRRRRSPHRELQQGGRFVGYGRAGEARAVEHLRLVMAEVQVATVRNQVMLSLRDDFENYSVFKPREFHEKTLGQVFDQVIAWGRALRALRGKRA
jgi:NAD(P)H-dependent FMN reductase